MNRLKRSISIVLVLLLLLSIAAVAPVSVSAATDGDYTYEVSDGKATITDYNGTGEVNLIIPDKLNGYTVTAIGDSAFGNQVTKSLTIPDTVKTIGERAFSGLSKLESVTLGDGVITIGEKAFYNSDKLNSVTFGKNVQTIGTDAFYGCTELKDIAFPDSVTTIENSAFESTGLINVTIGKSVQTIGDEAFFWCHNLKSVTISNAVKNIGTEAFDGCYNLESVNFGNSVTTIGEEAFAGCTVLGPISLPASVKTIGYKAFQNCESLTSISVDADNPDFCSDNGVVYDKDKKSVILYPAGKKGAFTAPSTVTSIDAYSFYSCRELTAVTIPNSVKYIGKYAFYWCGSIESVSVGKNVQSIGESAFAECNGLESVIIPLSVKSIGKQAFYYAYSLLDATILRNDVTIGEKAFYGCNNALTIHAYSDSTAEKYAADNSISFKELKINSSENFTYVVSGGEATITGYIGRDENIKIPSILDGFTVTGIGDKAFKDGFVASVIIPDTVISIGEQAFCGCENLTSVTLSDSVTSFGENAFDNCGDGFKLYGMVPSEAKDYAKRNKIDFVNCYGFAYEPFEDGITITGYVGKDKNVIIPPEINGLPVIDIYNDAFRDNKRITNIVIPDGVKDISANAFRDCVNLESARVPASVTHFGSNAWNSCSPNFKFIVKVDSYAYNYAVSNHISYIEDNSSETNADDFDFSAPDEYNQIEVTGYHGNGGKIVIPNNYNGKAVVGIAENAFSKNSDITEVTIPFGIFSIGDLAFSECENLKSVTFPNTVGTIGESAFRRTALVEVSLPDSVCNLGNSAFKGCAALKNVKLSESLDTISNCAFYFCENLRTITIPDSVESIGDYAFYYSGLWNNLVIGKNVKTIGYKAFENCVNISTIVFPSGIKTIDRRAFYNCNELQGDLNLRYVSSIGDYSFGSCPKLESATIYNRDAFFDGNNAFTGHNSEFKIVGYDPSTAKTFAEQNTIPFFNIEEYDSTPDTDFYYKSDGETKVTYVSTFKAAWTQAVMDGGVVGILTDVTLDQHLEVPVDTKVTLELNGHKLDRDQILDFEHQDDRVIIVNNRAELTVYGGTARKPQPKCELKYPAFVSYTEERSSIEEKTVENLGLITGGHTKNNGGGILVNSGATLNLNYTAVSGNYAALDDEQFGYGGGVCLYGNYAHLNMNHSEISNNVSTHGGGVAILRDKTSSSVKRDNSSIQGDTDFFTSEILSSIKSNAASVDGGGIYVNNSYCTIDNICVDDNSAYARGGGIAMGESIFAKYTNVRCSIIQNNWTNGDGGGIYNGGAGNTSTIYDNTYMDVGVTGNKATKRGGGIFVQGADICFTGFCLVEDNFRYNSTLREWKPGNISLDFSRSGEVFNAPGRVQLVYTEKEGSYYKYKLDKKSRLYFTVYNAAIGDSITRALPCGNNVHQWKDDPSKASDCDSELFRLVKCFRWDNDVDNIQSQHFEVTKVHCADTDYNNYVNTGYVSGHHSIYFTIADGPAEDDFPAMKMRSRKAAVVAGKSYNDQPVQKGVYTYRKTTTDAKGKSVYSDADALFYYSDGYFMESAQKYNEHLATLSVCMASAAMNSPSGKDGVDASYVFKGKNIRQMMMDMGCKNSDIYVSETYTLKPQIDSIGYCIGTKKLANGDDLVIIAVRGGGYEAEWSSNVKVGASGEHAGFSEAATDVFKGLQDFLYNKGIRGTSSTTKFWIAGFSRAGATSNLTAKRIVDNYDNNGERTFGYPIEAPKGGVESAKKEGCNYNCIHNVINYRDIVPWVAMGEMDFIRYGIDHYVPGTDVANEYTESKIEYQDNYPAILNSDSYKAQKKEMIRQLKYLNKYTVYDDYFHTATLEYASVAVDSSIDKLPFFNFTSGKLIQRTDSDSEDYNMTVEEWLPRFWRNFTNYIFECEGEDARKELTKESEIYRDKYKYGDSETTYYGKASFQSALMDILNLLMAPSKKGEDFLKDLSDISTDDISTTLLLKVYTNYLNTKLNTFLTDDSYDDIYRQLWNIISSKLKDEHFTEEELLEFDKNFYIALRPLLRYVKKDYKHNDQNDLGTIIYNAGNLMLNHDPEVATAWIRSYDSYYTDEYATNSPVEYIGENTPQLPIVEVTSRVGDTETYKYNNNSDNTVCVGINDDIRFIPEDNTYSRDYGDTYFYCFTDDFKNEDDWHILNDSFRLSDYGITENGNYKVTVFSVRDNNFDKIVDIDTLANVFKRVSIDLTDRFDWMRTFTFKVDDSGVVTPINGNPEIPSDTSENNNVDPETPADTSENNNVEPETPADTSEDNNVEPVTTTDISSCKIMGIKAKTYNGKAQTQKITIKNGNTTLKKGTDYTVTYKNNKKAGKATVIITGKGDYTGKITKKFKINKAANPMTVKAKALKADAKKNMSFAKSKAFAISKAQGSVTFVKKSGNKKITINKKTGKITVKKGLKKGKTYTVKFAVKAAGKSNYNSKSKAVKVKIKVK